MKHVCPPKVAFVVALGLTVSGLYGCSQAARINSKVDEETKPLQARPAIQSLPTPVLLVGIDGFRYDYLDVFEPPNISALASAGATAERLVPSFPSKTFPNHYTLATGLVPDHHGIVSNNIVDAELGSFSLRNREAVSDGRWWLGEPIWATAQRQGLRSATLFWPGSEAEINGSRPDYWLTYDDDFPGPDRIDQVVEWLSLPEAQRPQFLTLYFSRVDTAGHRHGPLSHQAKTAVMEVDALIGDLRTRLEAMNQPLHWVLVSDHGMAETAPDRVVLVDEVIDVQQYNLVDLSPVLAIAPNPEATLATDWETDVVDALNKVPHVRAYRKADLPAHLKHGQHPRVAPVIALIDEGWRFSLRTRESSRPQRGYGGQHGYDPTLDSMGGLFVATGPRIRSATTLGAVDNVDVYSLLCALLGIEPAPNDGSLDTFRQILD